MKKPLIKYEFQSDKKREKKKLEMKTKANTNASNGGKRRIHVEKINGNLSLFFKWRLFIIFGNCLVFGHWQTHMLGFSGYSIVTFFSFFFCTHTHIIEVDCWKPLIAHCRFIFCRCSCFFFSSFFLFFIIHFCSVHFVHSFHGRTHL